MSTELMLLKLKYPVKDIYIADLQYIISELGEPEMYSQTNGRLMLIYSVYFDIRLYDLTKGNQYKYTGWGCTSTNNLDDVLKVIKKKLYASKNGI